MSDCDPIREVLLDGAPLDAEGEAHVASCDACAALSEALQRVTLEVDAFQPVVAPEALVARTLERVQTLDAKQPSMFGALLGQLGDGWMAMGKLLWMPFAALGRLRGPRLAIAIGAPALGAMLLMVTMTVGGMADKAATAPTAVSALGDGYREQETVNRYGIEGPSDNLQDIAGDSTGRATLAENAALGGLGSLGYIDEGVVNQAAPAGVAPVEAAPPPEAVELEQQLDSLLAGALRGSGEVGGRFDQTTVRSPAVADPATSDSPTPAFEAATLPARQRAGQGQPENDRDFRLSERRRDRTRTVEGLDVDGELARLEEGEATVAREDDEETPGWLGDDRAHHWHRPDDDENGRDSSLGRDELTGLSFRSPTGRWANTYVPGDPRWRLLGRRLRQHDAVLAGVGVSAFELAQQAQATAPRIAAPGQAALALSVQADRAQVEGQTRVLMQVGLRGAAVRGRRPTLRSVVLLDLRQPLDDTQRASVRSLLASISRARTSADRIGIVVAGPHGGMLVEPGQLRLGEVTVALRRAFSNEGGEATTLESALGSAIQSVSELSDADSPLGSGLVWLVTPGLDAARASALESVAHTGALAGVTTTTIGLSDGVDSDPLETVALAGHGRRWVVGAEPEQVVRREIQAASRVVARAVRLNVRLAPGTRLVDVLGSRPLSEIEAQRSAAAERAVDQQLASRLGIATDRERDDDGIQIVVPAFYADDTHTILLDLVVEGPGPVADVSIRYKDLLRLDNGESNERLVLPRGRAERGPRQRDVLRSWLSHEFSVSLRRAAAQLATSRPAALAELRGARARLQSARTSLRALASDRDLVRQAELCQRFEAALEGGAPPAVLADSLRFASRRLIFGDPLDSVGNPNGSPP